MIGVLGGMGPAATVDFMAKLIRLTPAERDQDHLPLVVVSDPRVPDRVGPILHGRGPIAAAGAAGRRARALERAGARCIAIPCHTAHPGTTSSPPRRRCRSCTSSTRASPSSRGRRCRPGRSACSRPGRRSRPGSTRSASPPPAIRRCCPRPR